MAVGGQSWGRKNDLVAIATNHVRDMVAWTSVEALHIGRSVWVQDVFSQGTPQDLVKNWIWGGFQNRPEKGVILDSAKMESLLPFDQNMVVSCQTSGILFQAKGPLYPRHIACFSSSFSQHTF